MVIVRLGDPGGVEPLSARIKSPLPNRLRLERSGSTGDGGAAASRPICLIVVMVVSCCVGSPARYRTAVFRLSAGCSAFELREISVPIAKFACEGGFGSGANFAIIRDTGHVMSPV